MNTVRLAYETAPGTIGPLLVVVGAMLAVALVVAFVHLTPLAVQAWPTATTRVLPVLALVGVLLVAGTPADATSRYHSNGCPKGSTVGRTQLVYIGSIPTPRGRICRYAISRKVPLIGWWPLGTVSKWARR